MPSVVILTSSLETFDKVKNLAHPSTVRFQSTPDADHVIKLSKLNQIDYLLVDDALGDERYLAILKRVWEESPLLSAGVFNFSSAVSNELGLRLVGAQVFSSPNTESKLEEAFSNLGPGSENEDDMACLLVEDLDSPRQIVASYIESLGNSNVESTDSAKEALKRLKASPTNYFCVITDLKMPEMSGIELIAEIRKNEALRHLPVIALTSSPTSEFLLDSIRAGATGFLAKPPRKKLLSAELEKAKRIVRNRLSPRLCRPEDVAALEDELLKLL